MRRHSAPVLLALSLVGACASNGTHHCAGVCADAGLVPDASAPTDASADLGAHDAAAHDAARDAGTPRDATTGTDAGGTTDGGPHTDAGAPLDAGTGDDAGTADAGPGCAAGAACAVLDFPNLTDTYSTTFYTTTGDYVEGMRTTTLSSATAAHVVMNIRFNDLSCDELDFRVLLNGTEIGTFSLTPPSTVGAAVIVDEHYTFASAAGPDYTVRYEVTHGPPSSCGPVVLETHGNSVALSP